KQVRHTQTHTHMHSHSHTCTHTRAYTLGHRKRKTHARTHTHTHTHTHTRTHAHKTDKDTDTQIVLRCTKLFYNTCMPSPASSSLHLVCRVMYCVRSLLLTHTARAKRNTTSAPPHGAKVPTICI